jgi:hypothetical protein
MPPTHPFLFPLTLSPPPAPPQRDGPNLYMTLHCHKVDVRTLVEDGDKPLPVPAGGTRCYPSVKL